jgi:hypothetical protein
MPAVRLGRWDGTVSFFTQGGLTYVNLLDEIIPILEHEQYTFDLDDEREHYDLKFEPVTSETFKQLSGLKGTPTPVNQLNCEIIKLMLLITL